MWKWRATRHVPQWASFFEHREYDDFLAAVAEDLGRRGDIVEIDDGVARVTIDGERHQFGLQNLAQLCNHSDSNAWADLIRHHFDNVIRTTGGTDLEAMGRDYSKVEGLVKVRLYPRDAVVDAEGAGPLFREVSDCLVAALVYDLPEAVATVPPDAIEHWPVTRDQAFELGLANVLEQDTVECERFDVHPRGAFWAMVGDSFFVTSRLLVLEQYLEQRTEFGALVSVPNRHTMLFAPIADTSVVQTLNAMVLIAHRRWSEGPGSLSPLVYWWRDGNLVALPADVDEGQVRLYPPEEFLEECLEPLGRRSGSFGPN